jgi:hypothetical protein
VTRVASVTRRIGPANVTCLLGGAATADLPAGAYDAVTSISALHHMDLPAVLPRLAAALRPGGLLIAVSHHRLEIPRGLTAEAMSVFGNALPGSRVRWLVHWRYELTWRKPGPLQS